jgi:hypothetical protein
LENEYRKLLSVAQRERWDNPERRRIQSETVSASRLRLGTEIIRQAYLKYWNTLDPELKKRHADVGRSRFLNMTLEERKEYMKQGKTEESRQKQYQLKTCPYCAGNFKPLNYGRWHGERCRRRKSE